MATNYDLKLVVDADTTEAKRKLDELSAAHSSPEVQEAAQRVRDHVAPSPKRSQPAPRPQQPPPAQPQPAPAPRPQPIQPQPAQPPASQPPPTPAPQPPPQTPQIHTPAAQEAADRVSKFRLDQNYKHNLSNNPDDFGKKAGDVAGKAIGKAVAGFLAHEVATTIFNGLKTPGGDNRGVNQAEAGVGGALRYGTMGAMLGGPLGAIIGGVGGAVMGVFQERQRQQKEIEADENATLISDFARKRDTAISASDSAFARSLELAGGSRQRLDALRARREEIANGSGQTSIKSLEGFLKGADPNARSTIELKGILEAQKSRVASLDQQILQEGLAVAPSRLDPGSVADSWAKRGVQVGAQVDVAQVNEKIMGEVQSCRALLEKIANMGTDRIQDIGAMQRAVYE